MRFLNTKASTLNELPDFYLKCGYGGTFDRTDDVFYAIEGDHIFGVVRISQEHGAFVLRGMQVLPEFRGKHIGRKLLSYMVEQISQINAPCYCLPHNHLAQFYGKAGFINAEPTDVPEFLIKRKLKYEAQGLNIDLLVRLSAP